MRKCPNCDKTFDDSMRFCQTDGTPLVDVMEEIADDPLKTTVVRQEDFASVIPPADPFSTAVADSASKEDSGDLLQLPENYDPMKTMVAPNEANFDLNLSEPPKEIPSSPFDTPSSPFDTPVEAKIEEKSSDFNVPEPPKFNEPSLSPPNFGNMSTPSSFDQPKDADEPPPTAIYMPEANSFPPESSTPMSSSPFDRPMEKPLDAPIPSPFSDAPKPVIPSFQEPVQPSISPFEQPASPFGAMEQQNQGFNQPVQNSDWNPQTPPVSNWQDQGGANTPYQPSTVGAGQDQTMAIVSLVCALASFVVCPLTAPVALVTGYMARKKAQENPQQFGGEGLALAGMIIGGIITVLLLLVIALYALIIFGAIASSSF